MITQLRIGLGQNAPRRFAHIGGLAIQRIGWFKRIENACPGQGQLIVTLSITPAAASTCISERNCPSPTSAQGEAWAGVAARMQAVPMTTTAARAMRRPP